MSGIASAKRLSVLSSDQSQQLDQLSTDLMYLLLEFPHASQLSGPEREILRDLYGMLGSRLDPAGIIYVA